ncbi:MAG TPA: YciI family protein [Bacteroidota bacterium]|nr:YciI family protein [Bacteroidota bacterium]
MRFMMLMIPEVYQGSKARSLKPDFAPDVEDVEKMTKYNEALAKAGALISLDGLHPPTEGARVSYAGATPSVTDGPYAESKEVLGGYWIIRAKSRQEAIDWAKRVPARAGDVVEVRQIFDWEDFPADVQKAADNATLKSALDQQIRR